MNHSNILLIYGFLAASYVLYKVIVYKTDIYSFGRGESFRFFFALLTGSLAIVLAFRDLDAQFNLQRMIISLIFLSVYVFISIKKFLTYKKDVDLVFAVQKSIWAVVIFILLILTLLRQFLISNDRW